MNKRNKCWVIKVTFLKYGGEVNFNEAYWDYSKCIEAIRKKLTNNYTMIDDYTFDDLDNEIIYEAKQITIYEEVI